MSIKNLMFTIVMMFSMTNLFAAQLPEGAETKDYMLTAQDFDNGDVLYDAKIAVVGDNVYLGNFAFNAKNCWIRGVRIDNTVIFPEEQLMTTLSDGTEIWFYGVTITADGIESKNLELHYDAKADEYTANCGIMLTMGRPSATSLNYLEILDNVLISTTGRRIVPEVTINTNIITQQPTGELKTYVRKGEAYQNFMNKPTYTIQDGMSINIVYAKDGKTLYMQAPISYAGTQSWVKGTIEGNKIHVPLYQSIIKDSDKNYGVIGICRWNKAHTYLEPFLRATEITFTVDPSTGVITQDGDDAFALLWSQDMSWSYYCDMHSVYTPLDNQFVTIPKGLATEQLAMTYKHNDEMHPELTDVNLVLTGALDQENGKYYIAGLSQADPTAAIVGNVEGNTIVFPTNQFLGTGMKFMAYFTPVNYTIEIMTMDFGGGEGMNFYITEPTLKNSLVLTRDEQGVLRSADDEAIMITRGIANQATVKQSYYISYLSPVIEYYNEHPSTPIAPEIKRYSQKMEEGGNDCLNLYIEPKDTEGGFINPQRLAYQVYVQTNGKVEPYVFSADEYRIAADMATIPFVFSCRDLANSTDISVGGTEIYLYETGFENIGAQVINYSGGEEHRSTITWWKDPASITQPEYPGRTADPENPGENPDDQSIVYGEYNGTQSLGAWGTQKGETYHMAIKVSDPTIVGTKITNVRIPINSTKVKNCRLWIARDYLTNATGDEDTPFYVDFTPSGAETEVTLPTPFIVSEGEFYIGVTFTATATDQLPVLLMQSEQVGTSFIRSSRTYRRWADLGMIIKGALPIQFTVKGSIIKTNSVSVQSISNTFVKHGEESSATVIVANNGSNEVSSIDYTYTVAGITVEGNKDIAISADHYGTQASFDITVPAVAENGLYTGTLTITKVNGHDNNNNVCAGTHEVKVMNVVPKKRVLAEEFTGAWCGYCPSGYVAMKLMNERHPDDFVCASYHNKDAMVITDDYPVEVGSFPTFVIDRYHYTDAYKGDVAKDMGIEETWLKEMQKSSPVNVEVSAVLNEEGVITVNAEYEFCEDVTGTNYGVAYIVTADGLHGNDKNWRQHNYYSKFYNNGANSGMYKEGMDDFNNGPEYMFLEYDDVAIATSAESGNTISGVISADSHEADVYTHQYTFRTADMNGTYGNKENLVQDTHRLNVIALVYDNKAKQVINCNKCHVTIEGEEDGIKGVNFDANNDADNIYDLQGRKVEKAQKGIYIIGGKKIVVK